MASARWLLLGVFLVGTVWSPLAGDPLFVAANALSCLSLAVLLTRLKVIDHLWAWMPLMVFVQGYYVKTYRMAFDLTSPDFMEKYGLEYVWITPDTLVRGLVWTSLAFTLFCLASWVILGTRLGRVEPLPSLSLDEADRKAMIWRASQVGIAVFLLCVAACVAQAYLGFGTMGVSGTRPGFGIGMLIVRTRLQLGPALLLLVLWIFEECKSRRAVLVLAMLVALAVVDAFLRTSRGSLILYMLPVVLLWLLRRRLTSWRLAAGVGTIVVSAVLVPFITAVRIERVTHSSGLLESVDAAFGETKDTLLDPSAKSAEHVVTRVSGADGVWFALRAESDPLPLSKAFDLLLKDEFGDYYTRDVWGVTTEEDFRAPGLVGSCMVLGGSVGVVCLSAAFALWLVIAWRLLSGLSTPDVVKAFVATLILFLTSEIPFSYKHIVETVVTCIVIEVCWRLFFLPVLVDRTPFARKIGRSRRVWSVGDGQKSR